MKVQLLQPDCSDVDRCSLGSSALAPVLFWSFVVLLMPVVGEEILVRGTGVVLPEPRGLWIKRNTISCWCGENLSPYRSSWGRGRWPAGSRELCAGAAALEPPHPDSPFLSHCQAPGAVQDELWNHLSLPLSDPVLALVLFPSSQICLLPAGQGPSLSPHLPLAASARYNFIS